MTEGPTREWLAAHRMERLQTLERENEYLRAERLRLEGLLALALQIAVSGTRVSPSMLLNVLCALLETNPARPAFVEKRRRAEFAQIDDPVLRVLRETA